MLYVFHGTDTEKSRIKSHELLSSLREKKPDAAFFQLDAETWNTALFDECLSSAGLFERKVIVFLNRIFKNEDAKDFFMSALTQVASSENIVLLFEEEMDKKTHVQIERHAQKVQEYTQKDSVPSGTRNSSEIFALPTAWARKDKKNAWILYQDALQKGVSPEEIHGLLWWQVKTLVQIMQGDMEGLKPFVVNKSKSFLRNYSPEELHHTAHTLVTLYHESRRGGPNLEIALERFLLQM